jgi:hypothetical protein
LLLVGSGGLVCRFLVPGTSRSAFVALAAGLSTLHLLTLTGSPLRAVLTVLACLAAIEIALLLRANTWRRVISRADVVRIGCIFACCLPLWIYFLARPLWAFDARNTWFFHGRIIFVAGRFPFQALARLVCHDPVLCPIPDYPKLVGILAAVVATLFGYWNEYLPKLAMIVLHVVELVGLIELGWRKRAVVFVLISSVSSQYRYYFDSASLDIHVATLTLIAILSFGRYVECRESSQERKPDVSYGLMGISALALASQLKYEGRAITFIMVLMAIVTRTLRYSDLRRIWRASALFLPTLLWMIEVRVFHIPGFLGPAGALARSAQRFPATYFRVILPALLRQSPVQIGAACLIAGVAAASLFHYRNKDAPVWRDRAVLLGVGTAVGYVLALSLVYLLSPYQSVEVHILSSASRVTLSVEGALVASALLAWRHPERTTPGFKQAC